MGLMENVDTHKSRGRIQPHKSHTSEQKCTKMCTNLVEVKNCAEENREMEKMCTNFVEE